MARLLVLLLLSSLASCHLLSQPIGPDPRTPEQVERGEPDPRPTTGEALLTTTATVVGGVGGAALLIVGGALGLRRRRAKKAVPLP